MDKQAETADVPSLLDDIFDAAKKLDPDTGDAKVAFEEVGASIAAQRNAIAHMRR